MLVRWIRKKKNYRQTTCHDTSMSRFSGSVCRIALTPFIPPFLSSFHRVAYQPLLSVRVHECNVADQLKGTPRSLRRSRERSSSPMFCVCRSSPRVAFHILPLSLSVSLLPSFVKHPSKKRSYFPKEAGILEFQRQTYAHAYAQAVLFLPFNRID